MSQVRRCNKCKGTARNITPKGAPQALWACAACGEVTDDRGAVFKDDLSELRNFFRGATLGQKALEKGLGGEALSPAARALFMAQIMEYGTTMWFDGLKQGLLLGALQAGYKETEDGKVQPGQGAIAEPAP